MSEIRDRDEFLLIVNRLMICAMEDIDCGRNEAGPTTLDLVRRIEDHDAALRLALETATRERDEATKEFDRLRQDRYDALNAKTTEGWSAAEWQLRTGKAERERDATVARLKKAEDLLRSARVYHFTAPMATAIDDYFAEKGAPE